MITKEQSEKSYNEAVKNQMKLFKEVQKAGLKKMINPSLWFRTKLLYWRLYWKYFMPDYIKVKDYAFGAYYYIDTPQGTYSMVNRNRVTPKDVKDWGKHIKRKTCH